MKKIPKQRSKKILYIYGAITICILVFVSMLLLKDRDVTESVFVVPPLTKDYSNSDYMFSFKIPEDFKTRESVTDGSHTLVVENEKGEGVQIVVSPYDEKGARVLTKDMIQSAIPDLKITDEQVLDVGESYKGLAFKSDNDAFNGDSREVWFIFKGNLYQISTYSRFDELLKEMFGTWTFKG